MRQQTCSCTSKARLTHWASFHPPGVLAEFLVRENWLLTAIRFSFHTVWWATNSTFYGFFIRVENCLRLGKYDGVNADFLDAKLHICSSARCQKEIFRFQEHRFLSRKTSFSYTMIQLQSRPIAKRKIKMAIFLFGTPAHKLSLIKVQLHD